MTDDTSASELSIDPQKLVSDYKQSLKLELGTDSETAVRDNILHFIKRRSTLHAMADNMAALDDYKLLDDIVHRFEQIATITFDDELGLSYFEDLDSHFANLTAPDNRTTTGIPSLDGITFGGFYTDKRCLITMLGQPGLGKSLMLSNLAVNYMKEGKHVVIISLEMDEDDYAQRIDAHISGLEINSIRKEYHAKDCRVRIQDFHKKYPTGNVTIKEFPPGTVNCSHVKMFIEKLKKAGRPIDVIMVDYIALLNPIHSGSNDNSHSKLGAITMELRALSAHFNCPVHSPGQINGDGFDTADVSMDNIAGSKAIAHHADFIGALYRIEGDFERGVMNLKVLKNRFGGNVGSVLPLALNYENLRITDFADISSDDGYIGYESAGDQSALEIMNGIDSLNLNVSDANTKLQGI